MGQLTARAAGGRGALCILSGEPGIGKTQLADEVAARAAADGCVVSWGRAWETGGASPYWPWVEALGPLGENGVIVPPRVRSLLGIQVDAAMGEGTKSDPARERFELFESVSGYLRSCARERPLLLVFDDLHGADVASLELLSFVARGLRGSRIAVLGTMRDAESRLPPVADPIAQIAREGETLALTPLSVDDVAELIAGETGSANAAVALEMHRVTDGNPLFLREAIHAVNARPGEEPLEALREISGLGGVLSLVRNRLAGVDAATLELLDVVAVLGREAELAIVAEAAGKLASEARSLLEHARVRGLLLRRDRDRVAFSHVLVREALYWNLSPDRRSHFHGAVADALQRRLDGRAPSAGVVGEGLASAISHHRIAALPGGNPIEAVRAACRAAAQARRQLAYEEATRLLERALHLCDEYAVEDRERAEVAVALGWAATEAGKLEEGRQHFRNAAAMSRRLGDPRLLARSALGQGAEYVLGEIRGELVDALREALVALESVSDPDAVRLRARLLARLAAALTPSGTPSEPLALARRALAMTEAESDARTRIDVDVGVGAALADFAPPTERIVVNERLLHGARVASDRVLELRALTRLCCDYLERGDAARADAAIAERAALADSIGHPRYRWQTPLLRSMQAMPNGRFDDCEANIAEARWLARETLDPNSKRCIEFHRFSMLLVAGRSDELALQEANAQRTLLSLSGNLDLDAWLGAIVAARVGDRTRAKQALRGAGTERNMARMERVTLLEAAVLADDEDVCRALYATFEPSDDANACWGPFAFACAPPIACTLTFAAFALHLPEQARAHGERALQLAERMGADAHRAWVELTLGEGTLDASRLEFALMLGHKLGMPEVEQRAERALSSVGQSWTPGPGQTARPAHSFAFTLRRDGHDGDWIVERAGRSFRLKHMRGLAMLSELIDHANREVHALDLASERPEGDLRVRALGDAGEVIDKEARDAYKERLGELREELAEAEGFNDVSRVEKLQNEVESLERELRAAVDLFGRARRVGSAAERARISVQRRLRQAIKKIAEEDPELGRHLDWTVRTGTFCAYEPDGKKSAR